MARFPLDNYRRRVKVSEHPQVTLSVVDVVPTPHERTILFIHGAAGRSNHWTSQIAHFADKYRCVAPDLRGHHLSDAPDTVYSLPELMQDLDAAIEQMGLPPKFVIVAHSFGGALAISYAATRPERVEKLVLISTSGTIPLNPLLKVLFTFPSWLLELVRRTLPDRLSCRSHVLRRFIPHAVFPWNGWDLLPSIAAPTLVIVGERDKVVPRESSEKMAALIANAEVEVVRWAAHMPILERPDAINRAIERFVESQVRSWRGSVEEVAPLPRPTA